MSSSRSDAGTPLDSASRLSTFATLGALGVTQELAAACVGEMDGADPDLVAEESLCLAATATARALEVGLESQSDLARAATTAALSLPGMYREYLVGGAMIVLEDPQLANTHSAVAERLERKMQFYAVHLPAGQFPGERALREKMGLWMGRISPPGLHDLPDARVDRLELVPIVHTHLRLVLSYARREAARLTG